MKSKILTVCLSVCCALMGMTVVFQASSKPVRQQKITYIEQPRPDRTEDTTIVVYKPEVRQPVQKVIVVDERYERLKAEHEQRMREWHSNTVVIK